MCDEVTKHREAARLVRSVLLAGMDHRSANYVRDAIADLLDPPDDPAQIVKEMRALVETTGPNGWVRPETLSRYADRIEAVCKERDHAGRV